MRLMVALLFFVSTFVFSLDQQRVVFLHTNDLHGWVLPFDYEGSNAAFMAKEFLDDGHTGPDLGGLARRATKIAEIRNTSVDPVVLTDSGDLFTRGPWQKTFLGTLEVNAYNRMHYDAVCVGNNEFKGKEDSSARALLVDLVQKSDFPWLCANLVDQETQSPIRGIRGSVVLSRGALKIGILGLTSSRSNSYRQMTGWEVKDPIETAQLVVPELRKECDIVVALTHIGFALDCELARTVDGIDVIIGGDSHTFLDEVYSVKNPHGVAVPIVQAGAYGVELGELDIVFEKNEAWTVGSAVDKLIRIDSSIPEDGSVRQVVNLEIERLVN